MEEELINHNGQIVNITAAKLDLSNDFFENGLILTEKLMVLSHKIMFAEAHYFNLMAAMRISRIEIPLSFTPEFFEQQIQLLLEEYATPHLSVRFDVYYSKNKVHFIIKAEKAKRFYFIKEHKIDLYREAYVGNTFFDRLNFLNPVNHILEIYCKENDFDDLLLQNDQKKLARSVYGSVFLINGTKLSTPSIDDGAKDSVLRSKIISLAKKLPEFDEVVEGDIFPFAATKAEELFIAIDGKGVISLKSYKKTKYATDYTKSIINAIQESVR